MKPRDAEQAHHLVIVLAGRRTAAGDPIEQLRVGAIEQGFEPIELDAVQYPDEVVRERAHQEVDLLCAPMPRAKQDPSTSSFLIGTAAIVGWALDASHEA